MKLYHIPLIALSLVACGGKNGKRPAGNDTTAISQKLAPADEATEAQEAVEKIYADVFGWYNKAEQAGSLPTDEPDFDAYYTSGSYQVLLQKVVDKDRALIMKGEVGFFDYNHWVCGQDYQGLEFAPVKTKRISDGQCRMEADITNCGQKQRIALLLTKENGMWKIDDFISNGQSEKSRMAEYVRK